jgi:hypothetical protein
VTKTTSHKAHVTLDEPARYVGKSVSKQRPRKPGLHSRPCTRHKSSPTHRQSSHLRTPRQSIPCHCQEAKLKVPSVFQHNPMCVEQRSRPQAHTQQTRQRILRLVPLQHKQPDDPSVLRRIQMCFEQRSRRRGHPNPNRQLTKSHLMHQDPSSPTRTSGPCRASSAKSLH